jgi:CheY-like chemotaxis protein
VHLIAMTGYRRDSDRLMARSAGFDSHLAKPIDIAEMGRILDPAWKVAMPKGVVATCPAL